MKLTRTIASARLWVQANERWLSPAALVGGFIVDALTIPHLELFERTILLVSYLAVIIASIVTAHALEERAITHPYVVRLKPFFPLVALFTFGSTFSAFLIFYVQDSSLVTSWPFILFLAIAFFGTELFKKYQERLTFQLSLLYFSIFSFSIYFVPFVVKSISVQTFVLSSLLSLMVFAGFLRFLWSIGKERVKRSQYRIITVTAILFISMQILYFTNIIPPIPLALRDIGIYHKVTRAGADYELVSEGGESRRFFFQRPTIHLQAGESAYAFSAIFAPSELRANIVHVWERFDEISREWHIENTVAFSISGGRAEGYRGYTVKASPEPGTWRVRVQTEGGLIIGRTTFDVVRVSTSPEVTTIRR